MVSTRGLKLKFFEGEKVLCYEPDPTKAKVLYESKVKDVVINKDSRGKKNVEYLIHFRGWNSSWDRCVSEEFILKDTVENRQLQKDLAEKSKLQFGSYLYRKERKKHHGRKVNDRTNAAPSSEDGSCGSPAMEDEDDHSSTSEEEDSSVDEDTVGVEITDNLRDCLETDYYLLHDKNKLHKLPCEPNVIGILETYWKHYANLQKCGLSEKSGRFRSSSSNNGQKIRPEVVQRNINICQEVLDGIRIYFDFFLPDLLLYNGERGQTELMQARLLANNKVKLETVKHESEDQEYAHLPHLDDEDIYLQNDNDVIQQPASRRRTLRSYRSLDTNSNGSVHSDSSATKQNSCNPEVASTLPLLRIPMWKALPEYVYSQQPSPPSLLYGATHLVRLFVKLPELLISTNMVEDKLKVLLTHLESFIDFLSDHKEWFGEHCYIDT